MTAARSWSLAVYDAFLAIVARRTADLIRLATNGTGRLPEGALHPDLVDRLTEETCTAAQQVLDDLHPGARLLPLGRHHLRRVPAGAHHRRLRRLGPKIRSATASPSWRRSEAAASRSRDVRTISDRVARLERADGRPAGMAEDRLRPLRAPLRQAAEPIADLRAQREQPLDRSGRRSSREFAAEPRALRPAGAEAGPAALRRRRLASRRRRSRQRHDLRGLQRPPGAAGLARRDASGPTSSRSSPSASRSRSSRAAKIKDGFFWFRSGSTLVLDSNLGQAAHPLQHRQGSRQRPAPRRSAQDGGGRLRHAAALALLRRRPAGAAGAFRAAARRPQGDAPCLGSARAEAAPAPGGGPRPHPPLLPGHRRLPPAALPARRRRRLPHADRLRRPSLGPGRRRPHAGRSWATSPGRPAAASTCSW